MKNKSNKTLFIVIAALLAILLIAGITYKVLNDENRLSTEEKSWITTNTSTIHNVSVINNINAVGKDGSGVLFDFIDDIQEEYSIKINPIAYNTGENHESRAFVVKTELGENDLLFYTEHYVLVGKDTTFINNIDDLKKLKIGIEANDIEYIKKYLVDVDFVAYENKQNLIEAFDAETDIQYMLVPMNMYLSEILSKDYNICFHLSDINKYYVFEVVEGDTLSSIIKKYYATWKDEKLDISVNSSLLKVFQNSLGISTKDLDELVARVYNYGFVNNSPYEIVTGGKYGGIVNEYLSSFKAFANVEFKCTKYKNFQAFNKALNNEEIDLYFDYYNLVNKYTAVNTLLDIEYSIIVNGDNDLVINSDKSLINREIYVLENSVLKDYFSGIGGVSVKTYKDNKELFKLIEKDVIIAIDSRVYDYYAKEELANYTVRYEGDLNKTFEFNFKDNGTLMRLFSKYVQTLDPQQILYSGINNHAELAAKGSTLSIVAKYILLTILSVALIIFYIFKTSKRVKLAKKIKKEDKIKFIDHLTSLKNRNYLNENIENWNKNTIYPQATIVIDLNCVQDINDSLGHEEGDRQIKAAANILIKTQLDNSDIMRTDGNEFLIYLVGYSEKQIVSYVRKLYKEFKNLPHEYGAAIGFSMITDDLKTLEDAINESVDDMKNKKEEISGE